MARSIPRSKAGGHHSYKPARKAANQRYRSLTTLALAYAFDEEAMDRLMAKANCAYKREAWSIYDY